MDYLQLLLTLLFDTSMSWARMLVALFFSVLIGLGVGIWAGRSSKAARIISPIVDVLQTLPILAFFPFVILVIVTAFPNAIGVNIAVVFLIITSMLWNIIFGVYESIRAMPNEYVEISRVYGLGRWGRLSRVYIPAAMPKVVEQSILSWSIGLFYLVTSEIFSVGNSTPYHVNYGIGVEITNLALGGNTAAYVLGIIVFIAFVIATRFLLFMPLEKRYGLHTEQKHKHRRITEAFSHLRIRDRLHRINDRVHHTSITVQHLHVPGYYRKLHPKHPHQHTFANKRLAYLIAACVVAVIAGALYLGGIFTYGLLQNEVMVLEALLATLARVWLAYLVILVIAVPVCVYLIFMSKHSNWYLLVFQILASIPATILLPIIAVSLSKYPYHGELVALVVFFLSGIWYLIFSIIAHRTSIQNEVFEVKKLFGVKGMRAWKSIYLRGILPGIITGSVTGIAAEWNASIVAEYFTSAGVSAGNVITQVHTGIGTFLDNQLSMNHLGLIALGLINLTVMIILINRFVWRKAYTKTSEVYK